MSGVRMYTAADHAGFENQIWHVIPQADLRGPPAVMCRADLIMTPTHPLRGRHFRSFRDFLIFGIHKTIF